MARSLSGCNFKGRRITYFWKRHRHTVADDVIKALTRIN